MIKQYAMIIVKRFDKTKEELIMKGSCMIIIHDAAIQHLCIDTMFEYNRNADVT